MIEALDLRGCKGQKRFAYRFLHRSLRGKAPTEEANPAFSSQMCPSCGYISRNNRDGVDFHCRSCGRISHADVVGGKNLLGRSEDKQISLEDDTFEVKTILRERYLLRRRDSSLRCNLELEPSSQEFTTRASPCKGQAGIALNQVVY